MDRDAFDRLALAQLDAVFRLALRLTRDQTDAADLVQETFARALRPGAVGGFDTAAYRGDGGADGAMRAWLLTICHNAFRSRARRDARTPSLTPDFYGPSESEPQPDDPPPAWDRAMLDWDHVDERLREAIESLNEDHREVLLMWGVDGLKYREIAAILGVPIGTVMSRLHRARRIVAERLLAHPGASDDLGLGRRTGGA